MSECEARAMMRKWLELWTLVVPLRLTAWVALGSDYDLLELVFMLSDKYSGY